MSATFLDAISVERVIDGRFPLLQELGGTEWSSAHLTELDDGRAQKAAIKIFPFESVDIEITTARWEVAETLSHPHLMPLFYSGRCEFEGEDLLYVVTEYADETLSQILPERPLSPRETREMLGPVLGALSYLHQRGLTHGHLRPTNIMVIDDQVKLSPDFGWCSSIRNIYDPPEAGAGNVSPAADVWSLGILLVEALTQQPPAWDRSQGGEPEIPATIPEPFFTICRECLRTDPEHRCTLAAIEARLNPPQAAEPAVQPAEPAVEPAEPAAEPAEAIVDRSAKPSYGFRAKIIAGAVLVLLLMVATFTFGWNLTPSSPAPAPQPPVPQLTAAPAPPAATAHAPSRAPTAKPAPAPAPASANPQSGVVRGLVMHQALPDIPAKIIGAVQGHFKVGIRVEVDPEGNVSQASIDSPGPSSYFANQALRAAQDWKFTPARVNGRAVPSTWLLQFQFGQSQSAVTQSEESP
jgi:TonB family protein